MRKLLREFIKIVLEEKEEVLGEPDMSKEEERDEDIDKDEQVTTASIAGYTLPLGASNNNSTPEKRKKVAKKTYGGEDSKDKDTDWYK